MLRLNIRQTMPRIGIHTQLSTLSTHTTRPEAHTEYVAPRSNLGTTSPQISIDSYASRHAYGYTNHTDFAREQGAKGKQAVSSSTSHHTQDAWSIINNAARKGHDEVAASAKRELSSRINKQRRIEAQAIPDPEVHITPGQLVGTPDPGKYDWTVRVNPSATVDYQPGKVEVYMQQQGQIRQWTTEGHYDIYA